MDRFSVIAACWVSLLVGVLLGALLWRWWEGRHVRKPARVRLQLHHVVPPMSGDYQLKMPRCEWATVLDCDTDTLAALATFNRECVPPVTGTVRMLVEPGK